MPAYQKAGQTTIPRAFNVTVEDEGEVVFPYRFRRLYRNGCALVLGVDYTTTDFKNATGEFAVGDVISAELASATPTPSEMSNMPTTPKPVVDADLTEIEGRLDTVEGDVASATSAASAAESAASTAAADAATAQSAADAAASAASAAQSAADDAQADADAASSAASAAQADADAAADGLKIIPAKGLVYAVIESNVSVSNPASVEEDYSVNSGQTILLVGQTDQKQNGAYRFNGNGVAMTRASNANTAERILGAFWTDVNGSTWRLSSPVATLGVDNVVISLDAEEYEDVESGPYTASGDVTSITGLNGARIALAIYCNGLRLSAGVGNDYTVSGNTATVVSGVIADGDVYKYIQRLPKGS
jgi:hypothetical protein